jgi:hypothetical protein
MNEVMPLSNLGGLFNTFTVYMYVLVFLALSVKFNYTLWDEVRRETSTGLEKICV